MSLSLCRQYRPQVTHVSRHLYQRYEISTRACRRSAFTLHTATSPRAGKRHRLVTAGAGVLVEKLRDLPTKSCMIDCVQDLQCVLLSSAYVT